MAKRKRRKKAANPPAKRKRAKRRSGAHRRKAAHNPRKRAKRRSSHRRRAAHNPGRRRAKRRHTTTHRRARRANPHKRHRRGKRRSRRNPGIPPWAMAGLAGALGLATFALTTSAAFGLTKRFDPSLAGLERNRYIGGALATGIGLAVAIWASPTLGAGVMGGGLAALAGTQLSFAIDPVFQLGAAPASPAPQTTKGLGAIFDGNRQQLGMGAIYDGRGQNLGAVFNGQAQMLSGVDDDDHYFGG